MSATASTLRKRKPAAKRKTRKKKATRWAAWWPLLLGVAITPVAVKAATVMALTGPDGLRLLYPWMLVPKLHLFGLGDGAADLVSEWMMYLQFPLYGLAAMLIYRWRGVVAAAWLVLLLHVLAVGLLFVLGRG